MLSHSIGVEFKATIDDPTEIKKHLLSKGASFKGLDNQTDTYFEVERGRLKVREGNIENALIWYDRENSCAPKKCDYIVERFENRETATLIKDELGNSYDILTVVNKKREIFYIGELKFHIDFIENFGAFFELEASGEDEDALRKTCEEWLTELGINENQLVPCSYSDMVIGR